VPFQVEKMKYQKMVEDSLTLIEMIHGLALTLSPKGRIVTFNSYLEDLTGFATEELRGKYWSELFVSIDQQGGEPENFTKSLHKLDDRRMISKINTRHGRLLFFEWHFKAVKNPDGKLIRLLAVGQDISDRVNNEGKLLAETSMLIERNKELTCLYGISKLFENSSLAFGEALLSASKLIPRAFQNPQATEARICFDNQIVSTSDHGRPGIRLSQPIVIRGEKRGFIEVQHAPRFPRSNDVDYHFSEKEKQLLTAVARHLALIFEKNEAIEKSTELEAQIRHADRLATVGRLAAGIAHELNNPLGDILGFAQLAAKHPEIPDEPHKDLQRIVTCSLYAREIIKKILFFSKKMPPRKTDVNLNDLIREWMGVVEVSCQKNGIEIRLALENQLPRIVGDPFQLNQVLVNLVNNAVDAMPSGGVLSIGTRAQNGSVCLEVRDTGVGMSNEIMKQIFTPFFTTKDHNVGTGLGLSVVHGIVETHGGSVSARSQKNEGAVFEVVLPAIHAEQGR
jgi:PAS domain S-box-containing protein